MVRAALDAVRICEYLHVSFYGQHNELLSNTLTPAAAATVCVCVCYSCVATLFTVSL